MAAELLFSFSSNIALIVFSLSMAVMPFIKLKFYYLFWMFVYVGRTRPLCSSAAISLINIFVLLQLMSQLYQEMELTVADF